MGRVFTKGQFDLEQKYNFKQTPSSLELKSLPYIQQTMATDIEGLLVQSHFCPNIIFQRILIVHEGFKYTFKNLYQCLSKGSHIFLFFGGDFVSELQNKVLFS